MRQSVCQGATVGLLLSHVGLTCLGNYSVGDIFGNVILRFKRSLHDFKSSKVSCLLCTYVNYDYLNSILTLMSMETLRSKNKPVIIVYDINLNYLVPESKL